MSSGVVVRFRDAIRRYIAPWLSDRPGQLAGKTVGFRFVWSMVAPFDALAEAAVEALQAPWPGQGTPTALKAIGRSRGMIRGQNETNAAYAARLLTWLDRARQWGSMLAVARAVHEYLGNSPRVRIYNRAGACLEVAQNTGAVTRYAAGTTAWNWDGTSHPERAGQWWDLWICVYPSQWANSPLLGAVGSVIGDGLDLGVGHAVTRQEVDALKAEINQYKSAHSHVVAVIWTSDATLFDPTNPASQPNGTWGTWGGRGDGPRTASGRNNATCRFWEL